MTTATRPQNTARVESRQAFDRAVREGRLSVDVYADNYAGCYMYIGNRNGHDFFKNVVSRKYDV